MYIRTKVKCIQLVNSVCIDVMKPETHESSSVIVGSNICGILTQSTKQSTSTRLQTFSIPFVFPLFSPFFNSAHYIYKFRFGKAVENPSLHYYIDYLCPLVI